MRSWFIGISIAVALVLVPHTADAHQIKLVEQQPQIVEHIDVSQAFYSRLSGVPQTFSLTPRPQNPTQLETLVPYTSKLRTDFIARVTNSNNEPIATLDGTTTTWTKFYEPFGDDTYLKGPAYEKKLAAGTYTVTISNTDNNGAYVLVFGEKEEFPPSEILRTLALLPTIKEDYFERTWMAAVFNKAFLISSAVLIFIGLLLKLGVTIFRHFHMTREKLNHQTLRLRPRLFEESLSEIKKKKTKSNKRK